MRRSARFLLAAMIAAAPVACKTAGPRPVTLQVALDGAHYRLANGLEVVLHEDRTLSNVVVNVRYHVGGKDDPPNRSGYAHLFEHLMFLGSKNVTEEGFIKALEDAGAISHNAHTTQDATEYYEVMPPAELPVALWLEADRMAHPLERVREETFAREREVVKNEWRERYDNAPYGHVPAFVRAAVFPEGHPYHLPPIGRLADLDRATLDEARAFAARFYTPANASLVVAGNFDTAEAKALVARYFGPIAAGAAPLAPRAHPFPRRTRDVRIDVEADVDMPRVVMAWPAPPPHARGYEEIRFAAARIAGMAAYKLQEESKIARDVDWYVTPGRLGSLVAIVAELEPKANPSSAIATLETRVQWTAKLERKAGYAWPDFPHRRTQRMTSRVLSLGDLEERAERIQEYLDFFGRPDAAQDDLRTIQAVRATDAATAAEELLARSGKVLVVVHPTPGAPRSGRIRR
jgi:zinc protease